MNRLILLRHGKAERTNPRGDRDRRLAERGKTDAAIMGRVLAAEGLVPELALVSNAVRTQETWTAIAPAFPKARFELRRELYLADELTILETAEQSGEAGTVMMVGHNPGLQFLGLHLLNQAGANLATVGRLQQKFPTCSAIAFTFDAAGRPAYDGLFFPSDHGGGGSE